MGKQQFTFEGKLTEIKPIKEGVGAKGEWAAVDFEVTENIDDYPQVGLFSMFKNGEHIKFAKDFNEFYKVGDIVNVSFSLDKNVYNKKDGSGQGVFYKNSAWKIEKVAGEQEDSFANTTSGDLKPEDEDTELPF